MKKILIILILLILLFFIGSYFLNNDSKKVVRQVSQAEELALARLSHSSSNNENGDSNDKSNLYKELKINDVVYNVYVADDNKERAKGLSGKEAIAENEAMLFIFDSPLVQTFWMKDMKFDLDIIWIDENYKIVEVTKNISKDSYKKDSPKDSELFTSILPVKYVLEVNAGQFDKHNFKIGDKIEIYDKKDI